MSGLDVEGPVAGPVPVSLRERKKQATRAALCCCAVTLIGERGLEMVTVDDIAAAADMSPRTFFNYFGSKEDAIAGWDTSVVADMVDRLRSRPADEAAPVALREMLLEVMAPFDVDHRELLERLRVTRSDPRLVAHHVSRWADTERRLVAALAERRGTEVAQDRYAALVVGTTMAAGRAAMMAWCDAGAQVPLVEELAFHLDVLRAGLVEPGEALR